MTTSTWGRLAAAGILTLGLATAAPAQRGAPAHSTPADHWRLVPALPTSCFSDDFSEKIEAARTAMDAEREKQQKINEAATAQFNAMDMMERSRRMQAFMMKDPQAAMKMMQAEQAAGTATNAAIAEAGENSARLEAELEQLKDAFRAATEQAVKPVIARQKQLIDARTTPMGEAAISVFTNPADHAQYVQLIAEENAAFERACAPFFGANGSFHKWASSYRTEVVDKLSGDNAGDAFMISQMQAMGLPAGGYKSTTPLQQANNFASRLGAVWGIRPSKSTPRVELKK